MADARAAYLRTLVLAALLGVPVAFAAVLFQTALHDIIDLVWDEIPDWLGQSEPAGWYVLLVPTLAGLIVAGFMRLPGHGGHPPLDGIGVDPVAPIQLVSILPAALASLALGLVLGPEAPLIALGLGLSRRSSCGLSAPTGPASVCSCSRAPSRPSRLSSAAH
jgi:H+/Cl- antiporter ClcA